MYAGMLKDTMSEDNVKLVPYSELDEQWKASGSKLPFPAWVSAQGYTHHDPNFASCELPTPEREHQVIDTADVGSVDQLFAERATEPAPKT